LSETELEGEEPLEHAMKDEFSGKILLFDPFSAWFRLNFCLASERANKKPPRHLVMRYRFRPGCGIYVSAISGLN
jgi:hypothetical protein